MRVTVLITLYNKGPYIEEAVRSVLDGTYQDLEVLVVDDGSTDDGPERVRRIGDPRVRLLMGERNRGRPFASNRGYDEARGEYLAILDADDIAEPERLARQVAFMDAHPEIGVSGSWVRRFGAQDKVLEYPATDREIRAHTLFYLPVLYGASIIRRAVMEKHGIRADTGWLLPGFDNFLLLAFAPHTRYANIQEVLTRYRIGGQNIRAGRDPVADWTRQLERSFGLYGAPTDDDAPRLMGLLIERGDGRRLPPRTMFRIRRCIRRIKRWNREKGLFAPEHLEAYLDERWAFLGKALPLHGPLSAVAYMASSGHWMPRVLVRAIKDGVRRTFLPARRPAHDRSR